MPSRRVRIPDGRATLRKSCHLGTGSIYLKNVSSLLAFQTASIPVTLTGVVEPSRFSGWKVSADGTLQRNYYLQYRDGGLYLEPDGTVIIIR